MNKNADAFSAKDKTWSWDDLSEAQRTEMMKRPAIAPDRKLAETVQRIREEIREGGDAKLAELTERLDGVTLQSFRVSVEEFQAAEPSLPEKERRAIDDACDNITFFHQRSRLEPVDCQTTPGVRCQRQSRPIERVGLYVPGGTAPLPSTVLMLGVPASLAGCPTRVLATPPRRDGTIHPAILYAAKRTGITDVFKMGGAQAVAAMAYGTEQVPKTDKIFGPGNAYVTEAKNQVVQDPQGATCDMPAGPSEVLVLADESADPGFVAIDLLSQAEHGADSQVIFVTTAEGMVERVEREINKHLETLSRRDIARQSLEASLFFQASSPAQALEIVNRYAPEHLIVQISDPESVVPDIRNAGSVFLGPWSPESVGDYASGTNHVLPTYGYARSVSGLSVDAFQKQITFQTLTREGLESLGDTVETLASMEGLDAHERAVKLRREAVPSDPSGGDHSS